LVDAELWQVLDASQDPFSDHRPPDASCDPEGFFVETGLVEVETGLCGYVSAAQPIRVGVRTTDLLQVLVYHSSLTSDEDAEGHVALMIDDRLVWEQTVLIPSGSDVHSADFVAGFDAELGTQAVFHLHNHGSNTWNLGHFRLER
jgi:hypothetical protein